MALSKFEEQFSKYFHPPVQMSCASSYSEEAVYQLSVPSVGGFKFDQIPLEIGLAPLSCDIVVLHGYWVVLLQRYDFQLSLLMPQLIFQH